MSLITKTQAFNPEDVTLSDVKTNQFGGKMVFLNINKHPIYLVTPKMRMPFKLSKFSFENSEDVKYSLSLAFYTENNQSVQEFFDKIKAMDDMLLTQGVKNSQKWFKKKHSKSVLEALYKPMVRLYRDPETGEVSDKYAPTMEFKLPQRDGKFQCKFFQNTSKVPLNTDEVNIEDVLTKGSTVQAVIKCSRVWFSSGKFGASWTIEQLKFKPSKNALPEYAFEDDSEDESGDEHSEESDDTDEDSD